MEPKKANDPDELGGWLISGRLGEGAFGTVFLAQKGAQKAAVKVVRDLMDEEGLERFQLEIAALKKLDDPYIAKILDSGLESVIPWFATEFVNGPTLDEKVKYEGVLQERAWLNLASNLFHALVTSHSAGVVHKDVKPSNIILGETGNKLIDFGIAHISGQTRIVSVGEFEGSRPYSSPESSTGKSLPGMDVFSAAATLAFAAKGKTIWQGNTELQLMRSINEDEPDLSQLTALQKSFLAPLLNKNISERPSSEAAYKRTLDLIANYGQPDSLKAFSNWDPVSKVRNRKKKGLLFYVGNSIVGIFLLVGLLLSGLRLTSDTTSSTQESLNSLNMQSPSPTLDVRQSKSPSQTQNSTTKPKVSPPAKQSPSINPSKSSSPKPVASSFGTFKESPPEASNLKIVNIFGRSFESSGGLDWSVPLTNSSSEIVPPITNLQFRLIGYPNEIWLDVGYKLKVGDYGIQAVVDKVLFELIFKKTVCPEFRFVRIENNLVVNVWKPGTPDCATDYIP